MKTEYVDYKYKHSGQYGRVEDCFQGVQLLKHVSKTSDRKVLFVFDYMPTEDLKSGRLLSGVTGELLRNISKVSVDYYKSTTDMKDFSWLATTYNTFKTAGTSDDFKNGADKEFKARLNFIINQYKPDTVVTFGPAPYKALNADKIRKAQGNYQNYYGVPIKTKAKSKGNEHVFYHVPTLSLNTLVNCNNKGEEMYLAGYVARNLTSALEGKLKYKVGKLDYKPILVEDMKTFHKMMKFLKKQKHVSIDTEATSLNRIATKLLTIQFAADAKRAFLLPIYHKDSPFLAKEMKVIIKELRKYFEGDNKNEYHIYTNATFDLSLMKHALSIRHFSNKVWDIFAGEFCFDENMKWLSSITGKYYYSLLNISMQYGCRAYYDISFSKKDRKIISDLDLTGDLVEYCCLDVIVPFLIHKQQLQKAKDIGYTKYKSMVTDQLSDMLHTFACLEHNGLKTDMEYLFFLQGLDSPIREEIRKLTNQFMNSKGVQKANEILSKDAGVPAKGLFGAGSVKAFRPNKKAHLRTLFFEAMGLKAVSEGKDGHPKMDKKFQAKYKKKKEVAAFTAMSKAKKLYNAYVKSFIKQWDVDPDMRCDARIRPHFEFLDVVTGRTSAKKPSLQQIPSRDVLGKHIKRLFITEEGRILIKVDYSAHEVRGWSIIAEDQSVADQFQHGLDLRNRFKLFPTKPLAERIKYEGDVHKLNAAYFFGIDITEVTKDIRGAVKQVIFGLIYQQGLKGLAESTGQTMAEIKKLVTQFGKRFPIGFGWFEDIKKFSRENLFVESPLGRRRHTWPYLLPDGAKNAESVHARVDRQSVNSPVQGMGSDFMMTAGREIECLKFEHYQKTGHYPDFKLSNSVHDSIYVDCAYEDFWLAIKYIELGMVDRVQARAEERHNLKFPVPLEIDYEIGPNERDVVGWDYSYESMKGILRDTMKFQKKELGYTTSGKKMYTQVMEDQYEHMPDWMKKQLWATGVKVPGMKVDVLSKKDHKLIKMTQKEAKQQKKAA